MRNTNRAQTPSDTIIFQPITTPNQSVLSQLEPQEFRMKTWHIKPAPTFASSYPNQVGILLVRILYLRMLDSYHLRRLLPCRKLQSPEQDTNPPIPLWTKFTFVTWPVSAHCKGSKRQNLLGIAVLFLTEQLLATGKCTSMVGRVLLQLFESNLNLWSILLFLLQVQAVSVHGNWLPECTALLSYPQGHLCPRDHWPPVLPPTTLFAISAWRRISAHPGLSDPWQNIASQWQVQLCSFISYIFHTRLYMLTIQLPMNRRFLKAESNCSLTRNYIPNTLNSNESQEFRGNWRP